MDYEKNLKPKKGDKNPLWRKIKGKGFEEKKRAGGKKLPFLEAGGPGLNLNFFQKGCTFFIVPTKGNLKKQKNKFVKKNKTKKNKQNPGKGKN